MRRREEFIKWSSFNIDTVILAMRYFSGLCLFSCRYGYCLPGPCATAARLLSLPALALTDAPSLVR